MIEQLARALCRQRIAYSVTEKADADFIARVEDGRLRGPCASSY